MAIEAAKCALAERGVEASELNAIIVCTSRRTTFSPPPRAWYRTGSARAAPGDSISSRPAPDSYTASPRVPTWWPRHAPQGSGNRRRYHEPDRRLYGRATCILFGDAAGAVLIEPTGDGEEDLGFIDFIGEVDGSGGDFLKMRAAQPSAGVPRHRRQALHFVYQDGSQVFKYAVRKMYESCRDLLKRNGLTGDDVAVVIPHQANKRIISAATDRLGIAPEKVLVNIDRYGNTVAALSRWPRATPSGGPAPQGRYRAIHRRGAGYTVGASIWRWAY